LVETKGTVSVPQIVHDSKYATRAQLPHVRAVFDSVPRHLGAKFKCSEVDREARARELSLGLELLEQAGLVTRAFHTSNGVPLAAEANLLKFKVFFVDIGLANRVLGLRLADVELQARDRVHRGTLAEQWVARSTSSSRTTQTSPH
jgi:predicted AAA+ superfamily ATPase